MSPAPSASASTSASFLRCFNKFAAIRCDEVRKLLIILKGMWFTYIYVYIAVRGAKEDQEKEFKNLIDYCV